MASPPINSLLNIGIPALTPDQFDENPEVKAAVELFINVFFNLQQLLEQYGGYTQKDITLWNSLAPTDTLLAHQPRRLYAKAFQNHAFGDIVNIFNNAGVMNAQLADAAAGLVKRAFGFCNTTAGILAGARGEYILFEGLLPLVGVVPGDILYLSAAGIPGKVVANVPPVGVGQLEQTLGMGIDFNLAYFRPAIGTYIQH